MQSITTLFYATVGTVGYLAALRFAGMVLTMTFLAVHDSTPDRGWPIFVGHVQQCWDDYLQDPLWLAEHDCE